MKISLTPNFFALARAGASFLALADVGGERDDFAVIGVLQPFQDDRGVEAAGIGEHYFLDVRHCLRSRRAKNADFKRPGRREPAKSAVICGRLTCSWQVIACEGAMPFYRFVRRLSGPIASSRAHAIDVHHEGHGDLLN